MSSTAGFSVVIPTHNRARLVARAIESVLAQDHRPLEVLVVDDGSTDDTEQVVSQFPRELVRYLKNSSNLGAAASRNFGASQASHTFLAFLDSDDQAQPGWLTSLLGELEQPGVGAACCGLDHYDAEGRFLRRHLPSDMGPAFHHTVGRFVGGVFALRKSLFDELGGYDASLASGHHTELAIRLIELLRQKGLRVSNVPRALIRVNIHSGARIRTNWNAVYEGTLAAISKHPSAFARDPALTANYLSLAGISRARLGRYGEARHYFGRALVKDPKRPVRWARWLAAHVPWVRGRLWKP